MEVMQWPSDLLELGHGLIEEITKIGMLRQRQNVLQFTDQILRLIFSYEIFCIFIHNLSNFVHKGPK